MRNIKITVGLTVTAELSVYDVRTLGPGMLQPFQIEQGTLLNLQDRLVDLMRGAAWDAAMREGLKIGSYTVQAIETEQKA